MIYLGKVTRVTEKRLYVKITDLGGKYEFGPLPFIANVTKLGPVEESVPYETETESGHKHTIEKIDVPSKVFEKGDNVVVAQIGLVKDQLVVLGKLM